MASLNHNQNAGVNVAALGGLILFALASCASLRLHVSAAPTAPERQHEQQQGVVVAPPAWASSPFVLSPYESMLDGFADDADDNDRLSVDKRAPMMDRSALVRFGKRAPMARSALVRFGKRIPMERSALVRFGKRSGGIAIDDIGYNGGDYSNFL